jgi:hypothetical protein
VDLPSAPSSKGKSLDDLIICLDLLMILDPSIYALDLLLMALHPRICGCNLFLVALHLLLFFLWT